MWERLQGNRFVIRELVSNQERRNWSNWLQKFSEVKGRGLGALRDSGFGRL